MRPRISGEDPIRRTVRSFLRPQNGGLFDRERGAKLGLLDRRDAVGQRHNCLILPPLFSPAHPSKGRKGAILYSLFLFFAPSLSHP